MKSSSPPCHQHGSRTATAASGTTIAPNVAIRTASTEACRPAHQPAHQPIIGGDEPNDNDRFIRRLPKPDGSPSSGTFNRPPAFRPRTSTSYALRDGPGNSDRPVAAAAAAAVRDVPLPRPPHHTSILPRYYGNYEDEATNLALPAAAFADWSRRQQQEQRRHHVVAAQHWERALMLNSLQVPFHDDGPLARARRVQRQNLHHREMSYRDDLRDRELQEILVVEALLAARQETEVRLSMARFAAEHDRITNPSLPPPPEDLLYERLSVAQGVRPAPSMYSTTTTVSASAAARSLRQSPRPRTEASPSGLDLQRPAATIALDPGAPGAFMVPTSPAVITSRPPWSGPRPPSMTLLRTSGRSISMSSSENGSVTEARGFDESSSPRSTTSRRAEDDTITAAAAATTTTTATPPACALTSASYQGGPTYVDTVQEWDILCGRGGKSNHHPGNKKYRHVIAYMKQRYRHCPGKSQKTNLSRQIVEYCLSYGARFLKQDEQPENDSSAGDRYYILSNDEARRKTSQALREPKMLKWTTM